MKYHLLKTLNPYFQDIYDGLKTFEFRINDRDFSEDDILILVEYGDEEFTNRFVVKRVGTMMTVALRESENPYVIMSLLPQSSVNQTVFDMLEEIGFENESQ